MRNRILLVDGNYLLFKSYFSSAKGGKARNYAVVHAFHKTLFRVLKTLDINHLLVAFDSKNKGYRYKIYPDYKGKRSPTPVELTEQVPIVKEVLDELNLAWIERDGLEADDVIATFVNRFKVVPDNLIYIFTGDKDLGQLITENVSILNVEKGRLTFLGINNFYANEQHHPWQVCDFKCLAGDTSDNIPGVRGIGRITALKLLAEFNSIEQIYSNLDKLSPRLREIISGSQERIAFNRNLVSLVIDESLFELKVRKNFYVKVSKRPST